MMTIFDEIEPWWFEWIYIQRSKDNIATWTLPLGLTASANSVLVVDVRTNYSNRCIVTDQCVLLQLLIPAAFQGLTWKGCCFTGSNWTGYWKWVERGRAVCSHCCWGPEGGMCDKHGLQTAWSGQAMMFATTEQWSSAHCHGKWGNTPGSSRNQMWKYALNSAIVHWYPISRLFPDGWFQTRMPHGIENNYSSQCKTLDCKNGDDVSQVHLKSSV